MASKEQLHAVAANCSEFKSINGEGLAAAIQSNNLTCENCQHFTKDHKCDINLVDQILIKITDDA